MDVKYYNGKPESFSYTKLIMIDIPFMMELHYLPQMGIAYPGTELGGYMWGFPHRLEVGTLGEKDKIITLDPDQADFVKERTRLIMERVYYPGLFPIDGRMSIDDIFTVAVLWGDNWHIGLQCGLNRDMKERGLEPLY